MPTSPSVLIVGVGWREGKGKKVLTLGPYGDGTLSSLFCLTLWKSYLFNCRTKLAKLLCLKCFGKMVLVNFSFCNGCYSLGDHFR